MKKFMKSISFYLLIFIAIILVVQMATQQTPTIKALTFEELVSQVEKATPEKIIEMKIVENSIEGKLPDGTEFRSYVPEIPHDYYEALQSNSNIKMVAEAKPQTSFLITMLPTIFMILVLVAFWVIFMQQSQGGNGKVMNFGRSKARMKKPDDDNNQVTFEDIAGLEEEKEELAEVVDFLSNPKKFIDLGARIPKGILMVGPPGTGKTYLSRAVAGEAGVPFFTISGSDFVEMFVGVGASRVRDLFDQAKKNSPCIIFIDEIDAVGRRRGAGHGGGHDEREQTLNQLLVEMDGFGKNEGVIVMAATNRPDILDPALLRPGRFDRRVYVGVPDIKGREAILKIHSKDKPLAEDVDLKVLARRTPGFTPADLENLMNEAALLTAREALKEIPMRIAEEAITKVQAGVAKKSRIVSEKERRLTAYHEAGHAVVTAVSSNSTNVHMITIIPRGGAGGFTMKLPDEDNKSYYSKTEMEEELVSLLGGRVAEALILDDISTGASNDIERATKIARSMVTKYGMSSKLGPISYGGDSDEPFLGRDMGRPRDFSEKVAAEIDQEVRMIIDAAYHKAETLLTENMDKLEIVAQGLLKVETLDAKQFKGLFDGSMELEDLKVFDDEAQKDKSKSVDLEKSSDEDTKVDLEKPSTDNQEHIEDAEFEKEKE
ncbi:MAG: ATP-dependent zinc metalloprotease FtsH [Tissierellales bacterium]|jgi:cell division protease FtsH|nr:ATP-dependent zinc metalloprotease FtsH [Tissierellales bacterium]